jgi:hypothetical protein
MKNIESKQPSSDTRPIFGTQNDYAQMFQMILGFNVSQIVHTAALYSLAEHLAQGPATPAEIAEAESINVDATFRLMRACVSIGLMTYDGHSEFAATPLLNTLHKDDANSLRGVALLMPAAGHWLPWGHLSNAIKTGEPQAMATLDRDPRLSDCHRTECRTAYRPFPAKAKNRFGVARFQRNKPRSLLRSMPFGARSIFS